MAYDFYIGTSFDRIGTLQLRGAVQGGTSGINKDQPDFSQWTIHVGMFNAEGDKQIGTLAVTNLADGFDRALNGKFHINAGPAETAKWPIGKAQFCITAMAPGGSVLTCPPTWYRLRANPMSGGQ